MARACPRLLRYGRFIWSRPKRQAKHCLPFLFSLYRLPYARYGCAIQQKFCSQLNRPRHSANMADRGGRYGQFICSRPKRQAQHCLPFLFPLYRLPYARYGCAIQRKFCSQLNHPRHGANIRCFQAFPSGGRRGRKRKAFPMSFPCGKHHAQRWMRCLCAKQNGSSRDVFRFRSRNRRCSADEEKRMRNTSCSGAPCPLPVRKENCSWHIAVSAGRRLSPAAI